MSPFPVGWKLALSLSILTSDPRLSAQVVQISGGASSLYQSEGGTVQVHGVGYDASLGAGLVGGKFFGGAHVAKNVGRAMLTLGMDNVPFDLPTDVFANGHYLTVVGAGIRGKFHQSDLYGFAGASSTSFNSPFFDGARAEEPAAILLATTRLAPGLVADTKIIVSNRVTAIESLAWDSGSGIHLAFAGGVGSGQGYGALSGSIHRPHVDLSAAYISAGKQFRRIDVAVPSTSESDRENVLLTVQPSQRLSFTVGHQNYLTPVFGSKENVRSVVDHAAANFQLGGFALSAMTFKSTFDNNGNIAQAYSVNRPVTSRIHAEGTYLISTPSYASRSTAVLASLQEELTPRWSVLQTTNTSQGQTTIGFGGSFLSNLATVSAEYQTYYVPAQTSAPFQQALIVTAEMHLFGRLTLHGGTFVAPDGELLETVEAESTMSREPAGQSAPRPHYGLGRYLVQGRVFDPDGNPVMGAAILLDHLAVYSDSQGYFFVREQRSNRHVLTVLADGFLNGGLYQVVSAPVAITGTLREQPQTVIVVERLAASR